VIARDLEAFFYWVKKKGKGFPYALPSVGSRADPSVQAVSPQVTISHLPGGMLPLLSAKPAVTFPAAEHHRPLAGTKLYCWVTEAHRYEQLAQCCYASWGKKTRWLYWVECHNTVFGSMRSAVCAQAVYFLHSTIPNVTCLRLSDASVIWPVTYFQFPIHFAFLPCRQPGSCNGVRGLPNLGHRTLPKMWKVRSVHPRGIILNWF